MLGDQFQQPLERPLVFISPLLKFCESDVAVDAADEHVKQITIRHHEEKADEHQLLRHFQSTEPLLHRCSPWPEFDRPAAASVVLSWHRRNEEIGGF
jgi:hypothetical protein